MPGLALSPPRTEQSIALETASPSKEARGTNLDVLRQVFDEIDSDRDGRLSFGEFKRAMAGRKKAQFRAQLSAAGVDWKNAFSRLDAGFVTFQDFEDASCGYSETPASPTHSMISPSRSAYNMCISSPSRSSPVVLTIERGAGVRTEQKFSVLDGADEPARYQIACSVSDTVHHVKTLIREALSEEHAWPREQPMVLFCKSPSFRLGNEFRLSDYGIGGREFTLVPLEARRADGPCGCWVTEDANAAARRERVGAAKLARAAIRSHLFFKFRSTGCVRVEVDPADNGAMLTDRLAMQLPRGFRKFATENAICFHTAKHRVLSSSESSLEDAGVSKGEVLLVTFGESDEDKVRCPAFDPLAQEWYWPDPDFGQKHPSLAVPQRGLSSDPNILSAHSLGQWGWNADMSNHGLKERDGAEMTVFRWVRREQAGVAVDISSAPVGTKVAIHGLEGRTDINNSEGELVAWQQDMCVVLVRVGGMFKEVLLRPKFLTIFN